MSDLTPLKEHNARAAETHLEDVDDGRRTGVACPRCPSNELVEARPEKAQDGPPPKVMAECLACAWSGWIVVPKGEA